MTWTPERIRALREHLSLSQTAFAEALGYNRYQSVSDLETGKWEASATIGRLLDYMAREAGFEQAAQAGGVEAARAGLDAARAGIEQASRSLDGLENEQA